jgi:hypothetical protein
MSGLDDPMQGFATVSTTVAAPQGGTDAAAKSLEAARVLTSKLLDFKVAKPPIFSGAPTDWAEFKFRLLGIANLIELDAPMKAVMLVQPHELELQALTPEMQIRSRVLYTLLLQSVQGRALSLLRLVGPGCGFSAWRALMEEYEPSSHQRRLSMLIGILVPEWPANEPFIDCWLRWERQVQEFDMMAGPSSF